MGEIIVPKWIRTLRSAPAYNTNKTTAYLIFTKDNEIAITDGYSLFYFTDKTTAEIVRLGEEYKTKEARRQYAKAYKFQYVPRDALKSPTWQLDWENDELIYNYGNSRVKLDPIGAPNIWRVFWDITEQGKQALLGINAWTDKQRDGGTAGIAPFAGLLAIGEDDSDIAEATMGVIVIQMLCKVLPALWKEHYYLGFSYYQSNEVPIITELLRGDGEHAGWLLTMPSREE